MLAVSIEEQRRLAWFVPQRGMDMTRRAGEVVAPFGHEGHRLAEAVGDLLAAVFEDDVPVGHGQGIGIADVDLFLARSPLAL